MCVTESVLNEKEAKFIFYQTIINDSRFFMLLAAIIACVSHTYANAYLFYMYSSELQEGNKSWQYSQWLSVTQSWIDMYMRVSKAIKTFTYLVDYQRQVK